MSCRSSSSASAARAGASLVFCSRACTEVRGRKRIQEANELYKRGQYAEAVAPYEEAEALVPDLPTLWLNKGYTCRQLIAPGGHDPESRRAAACALAAFRRLARAGARAIRAPSSSPCRPGSTPTTSRRWRRPSSSAAGTRPTTSTSSTGCRRSTSSGGSGARRSSGRSGRRRCAPTTPRRSTASAPSSGRSCRRHGGGARDGRLRPLARRRRRTADGRMTVAPPATAAAATSPTALRVDARRPGDRVPREGARAAAALPGGDDLPGAALAAEVVRLLRRSDRLAGRRRRGRRVAASAPPPRAPGSPERWRSRRSAPRPKRGRARRAGG